MSKNQNIRIGKGLQELMNENFKSDIDENEAILELNISDIIRNPNQPRKHFSEDAIHELSKSITEFGVIQPIICKKTSKGYKIVAGERRFRAARLAGLKKIPVIIRNYDEETLAEVALLENLQRQNLSPLEEAQAYEDLINNYNLTHEELSKRVSKSRSHITNTLGLLNLPSNIQQHLLDGTLSMSHARVLSKLDSKNEQNKLANQIINKNMSVRELESIAKESSKPKKPTSKNIEAIKLEAILKEVYGLKSKITDKKISISINNIEDIKKLLSRLES